MEILESTIRMAQQGSQEARNVLVSAFTPMVKKRAWSPNAQVSVEDMEQDLWEYFFEDLMKFDLNQFEARYFPIYISRRMSQHKVFILRLFSRRHKKEADYMKTLQEGSYEIEEPMQVREDMEKLFRLAGWKECLIETAMVLTFDMSVAKAAASLHVTRKTLALRRKEIAAILKENPELLAFLRGY